MADLVGIREYARRRGVSQSAVQKAIKSGRISTTLNSDGRAMIDPDIADQQWGHNTDLNKKRTPIKDKEDIRVEEKGPSQTYIQSRAVREAYLARTVKLTYEQKIGKLVEADKVKLEAFQAARLTRDILLNIPNKISHELAAELDAGRIHVKLTEAITQALEELVAEGKRRMEAREAQS